MFQHPRFALMLHKSGCFADVYGKPLLVSDLCTCSFSESTLPSLYYIEVTPFLQDVRGKVIQRSLYLAYFLPNHFFKIKNFYKRDTIIFSADEQCSLKTN